MIAPLLTTLPSLPSWSPSAHGAFPAAWSLAYRPFLDPLPLDTYWLLLMPPMAIAIALVYKAIKLDNLDDLPKQASYLAFQIVAFMAMAAVALWLVTEIA